MAETKIACSLDPADQEERFAELAEFASSALLEAARTPRGARLLLRHSDSAQASLWRLIEAERRCCSFLEFNVKSTGHAMLVEVEGPPAARGLIDCLFELEPGAVRG